MSGWIKLHRSLQDHFIYDFNEPDKSLAWIDILLSASYADSRVKIKSQVVEVKKGQWLVSQVTLQKRWKMSQNKVKRLLKLLENDRMISIKTNELTTVITVCNFDSFQNDERTDGRADERPVERATDEQSNDILRSKEDKEFNKSRKQSLKDSGERKRFTPPSLSEVDQYMQDICKGSYSLAEKFVDYYESNGWMVGKNKMKCWKAAVRKWCASDNQSPAKKSGFTIDVAQSQVQGFLND